MGSSNVKFAPDAESLSGDGTSCAVSGPIENITPEEFWSAYETFTRSRQPNESNYETSYEVRELEDGGVLVSVTYEISGMAAALVGRHKSTTHMVQYFFPDKDESRTYFYGTDSTLADTSLACVGVLKAYRDPLRLEVVLHEKSIRVSGLPVSASLTHILRDVDLEVEVLPDVASPSDPGLYSAVSAAINDEELTLERYWDKLKTRALDKGNTERPDGSVVVENCSWLSASTFSTAFLDVDKKAVVVMEHGFDESLCAVKARSFHKVLSDPVRIECYSVTCENRESGRTAASLAEGGINDVLNFVRERHA